MSQSFTSRSIFLTLFTVLALLAARAHAGPTVNESGRELPVAYETDVVVVGGSSGAVAAAAAAARSGAEVFLAAPRPYLGEDMCSTYRLWLEPGQELTTDLAKRVYESSGPSIGAGLPFQYEANRPSAEPHLDTDPPSVLTDGAYRDAVSQSVQYDGDVTVTADLGEAREVRKVHALVFQRPGEFEVATIDVATSPDGESWEQAATITNEKLDAGGFESPALQLQAPLEAHTRYVRFTFHKTDRAERILLGEIVIEGQEQAAPERRYPPTPMHVKQVLDQELLDAGVRFLYSCYPCGVLRDDSGKPAGIVMANFAGRQAVRAPVIIDATERGEVARMAGARFTPYPGGKQTFTRVVLGRDVEKTDGAGTQQAMPTPIGPGLRAIRHTLQIDMADGTFQSFARAENTARDRTWQPGQLDASEKLFQVPPDHLQGRVTLSGEWPGAGNLDLGTLQPAGSERLYVLGGCADVPRQAASALLEPPALMALGQRVGKAAAQSAAQAPELENVRLPGKQQPPASTGDTRELLGGLRPGVGDGATVPAGARSVPVLGDYDVVVVGGGTGGAPAGISAARHGAKTLVIEYLYNLGGVGTSGMIGRYYHGYRQGFTAEVDRGLAELKGASHIQRKMEWWRRELLKAGADLWFGTLGCGAFVHDDRVKGVVVATPQGRGVVLADVVIDSTGKADIAAAAGAECMYTDASHVGVQGSGLPPRPPGSRYVNTDWTIIDDTNMMDIWRSFLLAKKKYQDAYDLARIVDTRERRRIVGDFVISPLDVYTGRTHPDTVALGKSDFDTHGFTVHPRFTLKPPARQELVAHIPYRALLPKGLDGVLVTGLGISAHRDAMPILRMQPDIQNEGYAAGLAATTAVNAGQSLREIDIEALQKKLVEKGVLPENVPPQQDSFPRPEEEIARAVQEVADDYDQIELILAQPEDALPHLRQAYESAESAESRLIYAHILGMLEDPTAAAVLADEVDRREWDEGWRYTGGGQYGRSMSRLDSLIIALSHTGSELALPPIIEKVGQLSPDRAFSHFRAVAVALENLGNPAAAEPLAELLQKQGIAGHACPTIQKAQQETPLTPVNDTGTRSRALRELILARALYRCGDVKGLGESILREYTRDVRGHMARHAQAVLEMGKRTP